MTNRLLLFLTLASLPLGGVAAAQAAGTTGRPSPTAPSPQVQRIGSSAQAAAQSARPGITRGSTLVGRHIFDTNGASLGQIRDLVITPDGQVIAVIDHQGGGFTGVPLSSLAPQLESSAAGGGGANPATTAVDRFIFTGDGNQLRSAPVIQDLGTLDDQWPRSVGEHFGVPAGQVRFPDQPATPAARGAPPVDSSSMGSAQQARRAMAFQSLMKRQLTTASGERIGNLRDVAIDLDTGRASFVVFGRPGTGATGATGAAGTVETLHGVGLDAFSFNDASTAMLDMDTASIDQSTGLDLARLPREPSLRATARTQRGATSRPSSQPGQGGQPRPSSSGSSSGSSTPRGGGGGTPKS